MSTPFTIGVADPITGVVASWQEKAEELRLAVSERLAAATGAGGWRKFDWVDAAQNYQWLGGTGTDSDELAEGLNLQSEEFWRGMQDIIKTSLLALYLSPDANFQGLDFESSDGSFESWLAFCREAGGALYVSDEDYGWPRSVEFDEDTGDPVMLRGSHVTGDYIGPWIINSLVDALNNLTTFLKYLTSTSFGVENVRVGRGAGRSQALSDALTKGVDISYGTHQIGYRCTFLDAIPTFCTLSTHEHTFLNSYLLPVVSRTRYAHQADAVFGNGAVMLVSMGVQPGGKYWIVSTDEGHIGPALPSDTPANTTEAQGLADMDFEIVKCDFTNKPDEPV